MGDDDNDNSDDDDKDDDEKDDDNDDDDLFSLAWQKRIRTWESTEAEFNFRWRCYQIPA